MARLGRSFPIRAHRVSPVASSGALNLTLPVATWTTAPQTPTYNLAFSLPVATWTTAAQIPSPALAYALPVATWNTVAQVPTFTANLVFALPVATWTSAARVPTFAAGFILSLPVATWNSTANTPTIAYDKVIALPVATSSYAVSPVAMRSVERFETPTYDFQPLGWRSRDFWRYMTIQKARTVILYADGTSEEVEEPLEETLTAAGVLYAFRGGYVYDVTPAQSAALQAAGYQTTTVLVPA